jgi:hypothetical protein
MKLINHPKQALPFGLFFLFHFLSVSHYAQTAAFGGGVGFSSLHVEKADGNTGGKTFSRPQISLNIDYYFPDKLSKKSKGLYNTLFGKQYLQLRGQLSINQFKISETQNSSITTLGVSMLYFPTAYRLARKTNFFIDGGYKAGWNNNVVDPFHCLTAGVGMRRRLQNDWFLQTSLNYTFALYDYLDQNGSKGFNWSSNDGFLQLNVTVIKTFYNRDLKKKVDQARDSLAVSKSFSLNAIQKAEAADTVVQGLKKDVEVAVKQLSLVKNKAETLSKNALRLLDNIGVLKSKLSKKVSVPTFERDLDSFRTQLASYNISYLVDLEKANSEQTNSSKLIVQLEALTKEISDARQNTSYAGKFIPFTPELQSDVENSMEYPEAKAVVENSESQLIDLVKLLEGYKTQLRSVFVTFEKVDKDLKSVTKELDSF